jgi:hypothetical protein
MAKVDKCDLCGKLSPDENGLFISNNWLEVKVYKRKWTYFRHIPDGDYLICPECMSGASDVQANKACTGLGLVVSKIGLLLGYRPSQ